MDFEETETMIQDCFKRENLLNRWERTFIHNISQQLKEIRRLSAGQLDKLNEVWDRVTTR